MPVGKPLGDMSHHILAKRETFTAIEIAEELHKPITHITKHLLYLFKRKYLYRTLVHRNNARAIYVYSVIKKED